VEDLIEGSGELAVAVAEQELCLQRSVLQPPGQIPGLLRRPLPSRVVGDAGEVDRAAGDLNEEEGVEALEPDALDREAVRSEHLGGVLAYEPVPGGLVTPRSRRNALAAQDPGHLRVGDPKAELERLTLNASVPPARILLGQPKNERPPLRIAGRVWPGGAGQRLPTCAGPGHDASGAESPDSASGQSSPSSAAAG